MKNSFSNILSAFSHSGIEFAERKVTDRISYKGAVHLVSSLAEYTSSYVYIGDYDQFDPALLVPDTAFLFISDEPDSIPDDLDCEYAVYSGSADIDAMTEIIRAFFAYSLEQMESSEVLISTLLRGRGLNYLLDICCDLLQNPVILIRPDGSMMFFSDKYDPDSHIISALTANGRLSTELNDFFIKSGLDERLRKDPRPLILENDVPYGIRQLIQGVYANHTLIAVLLVPETNKEFSRRDSNIVQVLGNTVSTEIAGISNPISILFESGMHSILAGKTLSASEQGEFLASINWNIYRNFRMCVIEMPEDQRAVIESAFRRKYHFVESCKVTTYNDELVLFLNSFSDEQTEAVTREIEELLRKYNIYGGISRPFSAVEDIRSNYLFARDALKTGTTLKYHEHFVRYEKVDFFSLLLNASDHMDLSRYIMRELNDLKEYDRLYGTDYYTTLYHYIRTNNKRETALIMHIHKNTLSYRLQRISEILSMDIDSGDIRARLLISFYAAKIAELCLKNDR